MSRLYWVMLHAEWIDGDAIIGAESPLEAVRAFVAKSKADQVAEIAFGRKQYDDHVAAGRISDPYEESGYPLNVVLPATVRVVPMVDFKGYRDWDLTDDEGPLADSFRRLWDWDAMTEVPL